MGLSRPASGATDLRARPASWRVISGRRPPTSIAIAWLPDLTLGGLHCGGARLSLRFWREGELTRWEILGLEGQIEVLDEPILTKDEGR